MKIIIAGCGKVGYALAEQLNEEGHELTIIDIKEEKVSMVGNALDVMAIQGNATSYRVQEEAGVEEADLLIAVTNKDEVNLLCCLIARKAGHCQTIARVRDPGYYAEIGFIKEELGLSMAINPELAAASDIARLIRVPSAMEVDSFAKGQVELVRFRIPEGSPWANKPISEAGKKMGKDLLICILEREGSHEVLIPDGNVILHEGDYISVIVSPSKMKAMFSGIGIESRMIRDVVIAGGGTLAYYLAKQLLESRIQVKIIENNRARCDELSELLPKAMIIYGDASGTDLLKEEGIENADAFVSLTGLDEENVMLACYVGRVSRAKVITKINKINYGGILDNFDIGSVVSPRNLTTELIIKYVRCMQNSIGSAVEAVYRMVDNKVEALEFSVKKGAKVLDVPLADLQLKKNLLLCSIVRRGKIILPSGQDKIQAGDTIIVVTTHKGLDEIEDILA